jgi:hypothetical protein
MLSRLLLLLTLIGVAGCNQSQCTRTTDCQGSLICDDVGACVVAPDLAGTKTDDGDGGAVDGGATSDLAAVDDGAATTD